jgi:hypothetical protein
VAWIVSAGGLLRMLKEPEANRGLSERRVANRASILSLAVLCFSVLRIVTHPYDVIYPCLFANYGDTGL